MRTQSRNAGIANNLKKQMAAGLTAAICLFIPFGCARTEKTEAITAEITAAQMEGRNAAKRYVNINHADTAAENSFNRDIEATRRHYSAQGKEKHLEAFDSAYNSTLRILTVNADSK